MSARARAGSLGARNREGTCVVCGRLGGLTQGGKRMWHPWPVLPAMACPGTALYPKESPMASDIGQKIWRMVVQGHGAHKPVCVRVGVRAYHVAWVCLFCADTWPCKDVTRAIGELRGDLPDTRGRLPDTRTVH